MGKRDPSGEQAVYKQVKYPYSSNHLSCTEKTIANTLREMVLPSHW